MQLHDAAVCTPATAALFRLCLTVLNGDEKMGMLSSEEITEKKFPQAELKNNARTPRFNSYIQVCSSVFPRINFYVMKKLLTIRLHNYLASFL